MIRQDNVEVLLLHCELADAAKEAVVREFTGVSSFRLRNENQARDKTYAEIYKRFLEFVTLPETLVDRICNSTYTQHFYTENQIDAMRERWLGRAESQ
jgi:hypothetical protein